MKKQLFSLLIFLFSIPLVFPTAAQGDWDGKIPAHFDIHLMPIALAHPDPSLRVGVELKTRSRWSYGLSYGSGHNVVVPLLMGNDRRKSNYQMHEIRPEIKYYLWQKEETGWYAAVEGLWQQTGYRVYNDYYTLSWSEKIVYDRADFEKERFGGIAKMGVKLLIGRKFTIDFFSGVGGAFTHSEYYNVENPSVEAHDPFFEPDDFWPGKKKTPLFTLGLKVGIRLWEE